MQPRIPTLLGLIVLIAVVGVFVFLFENVSRGTSSAKAAAEPRNVTSTNITDSSFTVTWETADAATGFIEVTTRGETETFYDERDSAGKTKLGAYITHSVTATGISANTTYTLKILSNGKRFENNGKPYTVTTAPAPSGTPSALEPAYGSVMTAANLPAEGALVFLSLDGGQLLSTLVNASGNWIIPLNHSLTADLGRFIAPQSRITELIRATLGGQEANAVTDTLNDAPVPVMNLGKTYDFRRQQAKASEPVAQTREPPAVLGAAAQPGTVTIVQPAEGASLATNLPLVAGTGVAGKTVSVVLGITSPIAGSTTVKADGTWLFTPPSPLGEGKQSVTITSADKNNKPVAITHQFTVFKSGSQVLGEATPSGTLTPSPTAIPTAQPIPVSGNTFPALLLLFLGAFLFGGGIFLTRVSTMR